MPRKLDLHWQILIALALGVGAGFEEIDYTYEKNLKVLPSFAIAAVFDLFFLFGTEANVDLAGILHGEQQLTFHQPIPAEGTLKTTGKLTHYYDKGKEKGALVVGASDTWHSNGKKLFTSRMTLFSRRDGGFGGENAPPPSIVMPVREPDFVVADAPSKDQPLLYRLSGDVFALQVERVHQAHQPHLGRRIVRLPKIAVKPRRRRRHHHPPIPLLPHHPERRLGYVVCPLQVHRQHLQRGGHRDPRPEVTSVRVHCHDDPCGPYLLRDDHIVSV